VERPQRSEKYDVDVDESCETLVGEERRLVWSQNDHEVAVGATTARGCVETAHPGRLAHSRRTPARSHVPHVDFDGEHTGEAHIHSGSNPFGRTMDVLAPTGTNGRGEIVPEVHASISGHSCACSAPRPDQAGQATILITGPRPACATLGSWTVPARKP
jgi:hypothetical protein